MDIEIFPQEFYQSTQKQFLTQLSPKGPNLPLKTPQSSRNDSKTSSIFTPQMQPQLEEDGSEDEFLEQNDYLDSKLKKYYMMQSQLLGSAANNPNEDYSPLRTDTDFLNVDYNASELEETRSLIT